MIEFENNDSPFFIANKEYCITIEKSLKSINASYSGFCNSYGYEINSTVDTDNLTFKLKFQKFQTIQNGIIIPRDSNEYAGINLSITGLNKNNKFTLGKSSFRRLFVSKKIKETFPSPYFLKSSFNSTNNVDKDIVGIISNYSVLEMKLRNGILNCKINSPKADPLNLISDIKSLTNKLV